MAEVIDYAVERTIRVALRRVTDALLTHRRLAGAPTADTEAHRRIREALDDATLRDALTKSRSSSAQKTISLAIARLQSPPWDSRQVVTDVRELVQSSHFVTARAG